MDKQNSLSQQVKKAKEKLKRAEQLINLLSGEQSRWTKNVADLKKQVENLTDKIKETMIEIKDTDNIIKDIKFLDYEFKLYNRI